MWRLPPRPDRELTELVETYRPRQSELVDLLRDEGELTAVEHGRLREYLAAGTTRLPDRSFEDAPASARSPASRDGPAPTMAPPLAAAPLESDRTPSTSRPVPVLLEQYQISSLKQAGAVRARRQISYEEYMALKRHFGGPAAATAPPAAQ